MVFEMSPHGFEVSFLGEGTHGVEMHSNLTIRTYNPHDFLLGGGKRARGEGKGGLGVTSTIFGLTYAWMRSNLPIASGRQLRYMSHRSIWLLLMAMFYCLHHVAIAASTDDDTKSKCYSNTHLFQKALLTLRVKPLEREVLFTLPYTSPQLEINCLELTETNGGVGDTLCTSPSILWVCHTNSTGWACTSLATYAKSPRTTTDWGSVNGPDYTWRLEWDPFGKPSYCYPRDVVLRAILTGKFAAGSSLALIIFVIVLMVLVGVVLLFFGGYQLRKALAKLTHHDLLPQVGPQHERYGFVSAAASD